MTIDEFTKKNDLPEMELFGEMKNFRYWIKKDRSDDNEEGIPMIILENKIKNTFDICNSDAALAAMALFS